MAEANPLKVAFARNHPAELAAFLAAQPTGQLLAALHGLPADVGAGVIAKLPHTMSVKLLADQSDEVVASWLARAALDDALTLVLHLGEERRERILATLPIRQMRRTLERLVVYPKRTVGALVDPTVVRVAATTSLQEAITMLRAGDYGELEWIWIVDQDSRYVGLLDLSKALLARSDQFQVGELAVHLEPLRAETALLAARDISEWMKHPELPVVDHQNHLLGALSRVALVAALAEEQPSEQGVVDGITSLTEEYFRVMGLCLGDLLGLKDSR
ncbi:MAG: CBS domain-containing protein [Pseudomonadales bacterium]